ncbi:MAG: hypothetical protein LBR06_07575 [Bacteroidales bacterium]|jgi:hypothetical protein|nr:hypothetical protein [Bacteroidales bacterium]
MYKFLIFTATAAIMAALSSCSQEYSVGAAPEPYIADPALVTLHTCIQSEVATRASHNGGAVNVDTAQYNLRYILEAWTTGLPLSLAARYYKVITGDFATRSVEFKVELLPASYIFVCWADFVADTVTAATAHDADLFYSTNNGKTVDEIKANPACDPGLRNIVMRNTDNYTVNCDARDAYFTRQAILANGDTYETMAMKRPLAKVRIVSLSKPSELQPALAYIKMCYYSGMRNTFNALTGDVDGDIYSTFDTSLPLYSTVYTEDVQSVTAGGKTYPDAKVLTFDYFFPHPDYDFQADIYGYSADSVEIGYVAYLPAIPLAANKLITVVGNFFYSGTTVAVEMTDLFDSDGEVEYDNEPRILD